MREWGIYQENTYENPEHELVRRFVEKYNIKTAVDLGCGSGNESVYMVKNGIKVYSIDANLNEKYILDRLDGSQKELCECIKADFETVNLPKVDAVFCIFSIPFCKKEYFDALWDKIYDSINDNGYFVGQLFGDRDGWADDDTVCTFTKSEVDEYLKRYKVLHLKEIEYVRKTDNKKWHFYNIIAKKI